MFLRIIFYTPKNKRRRGLRDSGEMPKCPVATACWGNWRLPLRSAGPPCYEPPKFPGAMKTTPDPQDCPLGRNGTPLLLCGGILSPVQYKWSQPPFLQVKGLEARLQLPELTDPGRQRRASLSGSLPSPGAFLSLANPSLAGRSRGGEKYAGVWFEASVRWRGEDADRGARRGESGSSRSGRSRRAAAWRQPRLPSKCG